MCIRDRSHCTRIWCPACMRRGSSTAARRASAAARTGARPVWPWSTTPAHSASSGSILCLHYLSCGRDKSCEDDAYGHEDVPLGQQPRGTRVEEVPAPLGRAPPDLGRLPEQWVLAQPRVLPRQACRPTTSLASCSILADAFKSSDCSPSGVTERAGTINAPDEAARCSTLGAPPPSPVDPLAFDGDSGRKLLPPTSGATGVARVSTELPRTALPPRCDPPQLKLDPSWSCAPIARSGLS
eukprot:3809973-Prymnesium_polylepis.1